MTAASTPALSASSDVPPMASSAALAITTNFYDFTTSQRSTNSLMSSAAGGARFDDQLQHGWMQALMAQSNALYQPAGSSYALGHQHQGGSPHVQAVGEFQTQSSDSDSDDITKSLSYLLNQNMNQSDTTSSEVSSQYHSCQQSSGFLMPPHGNNGVGYSSALSSMLEMGGYDGGRRVISMPNPLDSLSLDLPIHPPPSQPVVQPMLGIMPSHLMSAKDASAIGFSVSGGSSAAGPPQYGFLSGSAGAMQPHTPSATGLAGQGGECMSHFLGFGSSGPAFTPTPIAHQPPPISIDASRSALGITTAKRGSTSGNVTQSAKRAVGTGIGGNQKSAAARPRRGRPLLATGDSAHLAAKLKPRGGTACGPGNIESPSTGFDTPAVGATPSGMSTPTLSSALIPHRVDRQLAEASRPLFFVRPRTNDDQPRRRKRRCVSSGASLSHSAKPASVDAIQSTAAKDDEGVGKCDAAEEPNLQWQRISEQRRRDAMRENFDLLKRMLPQGYMASDDGRELARPVLLARFLRWVDDTLIEMESLKGEVAHLRLAQSSGLWSCPNAGPMAEAAASPSPLPPHQNTLPSL
ncbi:hypothetical protein GGI20_001122 [Coemansia sp. BCRC 34301]|nr:hypothetical protein GGI20_001122 [Coemansia sp. BCRC 34301]